MKRFAPLIVDANGCDAPPMANVWHGEELVGEVTSGAWGYRVNKSIAHSVIRIDLTEPGTELEVEIFGARHKAVVQPDAPIWDPENERLRG